MPAKPTPGEGRSVCCGAILLWEYDHFRFPPVCQACRHHCGMFIVSQPTAPAPVERGEGMRERVEAMIAHWEATGDAVRFRYIYADDILAFASAEVVRAMAEHGMKPCIWTEDEDGNWDTACGETWVFEGGPKENRVRLCPSCGHPVEAMGWKEPPHAP